MPDNTNRLIMKYLFGVIIFVTTIFFLACNQSINNKKQADENQAVLLSETDSLSLEIEKDTMDANLFNNRAIAYLKEGNINKALADINKALQINDANPDFYITLSDIYMAMGNGKKCENALLKAMNLKDDNINALLKLGELNFILRDYKDAIKYLNQAIFIDPNNPVPYLIKAYSYLEGGDTNTAINNFLVTIDKDQNNHDAHIQLALIHSIRKNELAIAYFNNAIDSYPESMEAYYGLAMYYQSIFDVDNSISTYEKLLRIHPQFKLAHYNLGYVYLVFHEDFEKAREYFTGAINIDPEYTEAFYNRGYCNELLGNYLEAARDYEKVLELHTNYEKAVEGLNRLADRTD